MTQRPGNRSAAERVLDVAFYAPLGLALSALEAVPELARKGRDRLRPQVGLARTVGQLAVREGYRQFVVFSNANPSVPLGPFSPARPRSTTSPEAPVPEAPVSEAPVSEAPAETAANGNRMASISRLEPVRHADEVVEDGLSAAELAIPSYDSLSAPQVLQRLDGLSREEVAAVRVYEAATRGRRTILTRADQILG
jgi:hypothetical protein